MSFPEVERFWQKVQKGDASQVREIRERHVPGTVRIVDLAGEYGVSKSQIWNIVSRREWNEMPEVG